jgi:RAMA domain-containing protein
MEKDMSDARRAGLRDLVSAGLIASPLRVVRTYQGEELEALVAQDGTVQFQGGSYPSLSAAAVAAIKSTRATRQGSAINGWQFWKYRDEQGTLRKMDDLRARLGSADRPE